MMALAKGKVPVTEDMIKGRYEATHGLRVQVIDIVLHDLNQVEELRKDYAKSFPRLLAEVAEPSRD